MAVRRSTYSAMVSKIEQLQAQAEKLRRKEAQEVIERIKSAIGVYQLTPQDLFGKGPDGKKRAPKPAVKRRAKKPRANGRTVKFRDGDGNTWGGMGPRPTWLRQALDDGKSLDDFRVAALK